MRRLLAVGLVTLVLVAGCGSKSTPGSGGQSPSAPGGSAAAPAPANTPATESNPPGDIPDTTAFVAYRDPAGAYTVKVPEGWARTSSQAGVTFTDKLNTVQVTTRPMPAAPTVDSARKTEVPQLQGASKNFTLKRVTTVQRQAGRAVLVGYEVDSAPNPVTGKVIRDEVERYEFHKDGTEAVVTLSGPRGADNVDPWRTVSDSFGWLR